MKYLFWLSLIFCGFLWADTLFEDNYPNGKTVQITYDDKDRITQIIIQGIGKVLYRYENDQLLGVFRYNTFNELQYSHIYRYDLNDSVFSEDLIGNVGRVTYYKDDQNHRKFIESLYSIDIYECDSCNRITRRSFDGNTVEYIYNDLGELITVKEDAEFYYDQKGNLTRKRSSRGEYKYIYNDSNQLIQVLVGST